MQESKIKEIIHKIFKEQNIEIVKIILFGSRARGDYRKRSDWDLLIIVVKDKLSRKEKLELYLIRKRLADEFIPCDVLIKSEEEVKEREKVIGSVIKTAIKEGIIL